MEHMKVVHVLILMSGNLVPYTASEIRTPVVGNTTVLFSLFKIEEFTIFSLWIFTGLYKPFMLIGTVIYYQIHQNIHITFFRFLQKTVNILDGTESGIDIVIIGNVISLIS